MNEYKKFNSNIRKYPASHSIYDLNILHKLSHGKRLGLLYFMNGLAEIPNLNGINSTLGKKMNE